MNKETKEAKEHGTPIYVPGGAVKGWEYKGDFFDNPDWTPPPPPPPRVRPKPRCQECGTEIEGKVRKMMRGLAVISLCNQCIKKYGG